LGIRLEKTEDGGTYGYVSKYQEEIGGACSMYGGGRKQHIGERSLKECGRLLEWRVVLKRIVN